MPRNKAPGVTLDAQLQHLARTAPRPAPRDQYAFTPPAAATEAPKMDGIRLSRNMIVVHGRTFNREDFRAELQRIVAEQRRDPKSAFNNPRDPNHQRTIDELSLAHAWLAGEIDEAGERAIVDEWHQSAQEESTQMTAEQQLAQLMQQPGTAAALQKSRTDSRTMTPEQRQIVAEHNRLEAAISAQAHAERPAAFRVGDNRLKGTDKFTPSRISDLAKLPPKEQANKAREMATAMRNDPASAFNNEHHPDHAAAVREMSQLYDAQYMAADGAPVITDEK